MLLFRDNRIIHVDIHEDSIHQIYFVKSRQECIDKYPKSGFKGKTPEELITQDQVCTIALHEASDSVYRSYYWAKEIQSPYGDRCSDMGQGGSSQQKGEIIDNMLKYNYRVFIVNAEGQKFELRKGQDPIVLAPETTLYYAAPIPEPTKLELIDERGGIIG